MSKTTSKSKKKSPLPLLPRDSFLSDVQTFAVREGQADVPPESELAAVVGSCLEHGRPLILRDGDEGIPDIASAVLAIPVYRNEAVASIVVFVARAELLANVEASEPVGVFESWEPIGRYEELALAAGFYGKMQRFANVSSFVRFERGSGLPGQVWEKHHGVVHDQLSSHPGFLRAAGASADLLRMAVGIPVGSANRFSSVLLISSEQTPIARGFEVWTVNEGATELLGGSYINLEESYQLDPGATCSSDSGWKEQIEAAGGAVFSRDLAVLNHGRGELSGEDHPRSGVAIPSFEGERLDSFVVLLF